LRGASGEAAFGPLSATTLSATGTATLPHIHGSIAGNLYLHVRNTSGGPLTRGTPVYITGNVGNTDRVTVSAADSTNPAKMPAVALLDQTLANNGDGDGIIVGELDAANTNAFLLNQELFVGVGALTGTKPTTGEIQSVGVVSRVNPNTGVIVTNLQGRHPQYASLAGANTFTSASNSFTQPLYLNSAILGTVTTPIAGAYNGNGSGLTGDAQNLIVGYATLAGVAYSFAGTLPIESGGTGGSTAGAARTALGIPTPPESKIATGDISITNDATSLTNSSRDDFDIVNFSLDANSTYRFTIYFEYTSTSAAGIKIGVNFPSLAGNGAQRGGVVINPSGAIANFPQVAASLYQFATGVATTRGTIVATIIARTGIVGGIGSLRWAQLTSGPDITTRHAGSSMTVEKLTT
jgi:hypothetical protein